MPTDPAIVEAEKRFATAIGNVWQRPPLAKCASCQKRFYDWPAIKQAEAEGCPVCGGMSMVEGTAS